MLGKTILMLTWALRLAGGEMSVAVLSDNPTSAGRTTRQIPILLVPRNDLSLYSHVHVSSVSPTEPLVTCQVHNNNHHQTLEAMPGVRVVLRRPILVSTPETVIPFPSELNVVHEGLRMSLPVGALLAPVQGPIFTPHVIRVLYAVPAGPLTINYPFYSHPQPQPQYVFSHYRPTVLEFPGTTPMKRPTYPRPSEMRPPQGSQRPSVTPSEVDDLLGAHRRPSPPLVTVLDFPSAIATPEALYYQPPIQGELGNRGPPEAVVPAGVVQSAQPRPSLQPFLNSKESIHLQGLRDQAAANKDMNAVGVESL